MLHIFTFSIVFLCQNIIAIVGIPLEDVDLGYCGKMETTFDIDYIRDDQEYQEELSDHR